MKRWIACIACVLLSFPSLAQADEPHQNAEIKTIMERYKQGAEFERIPSMTAEQRGKLMAYYLKGKAAGVKDRLLATGMGSIVAGYNDIDAVRAFVETYQKTGKRGKYLPLPHVSFTNAAEKFPEAQTMFASELEATKKMEAQIKSILETITADAEKRTTDADKQTSASDRSLCSKDTDQTVMDLEKWWINSQGKFVGGEFSTDAEGYFKRLKQFRLDGCSKNIVDAQQVFNFLLAEGKKLGEPINKSKSYLQETQKSISTLCNRTNPHKDCAEIKTNAQKRNEQLYEWWPTRLDRLQKPQAIDPLDRIIIIHKAWSTVWLTSQERRIANSTLDIELLDGILKALK